MRRVCVCGVCLWWRCSCGIVALVWRRTRFPLRRSYVDTCGVIADLCVPLDVVVSVMDGVVSVVLFFLLGSQAKDIRTLDKLYDGVNNTWDDSHMWLAPYSPHHAQIGNPNLIFLYFDTPLTVSLVKVRVNVVL